MTVGVRRSARARKSVVKFQDAAFSEEDSGDNQAPDEARTASSQEDSEQEFGKRTKATRKPRAGTTTRRKGKGKAIFDGFEIHTDNSLFQVTRNGGTGLEEVIDEWIQAYMTSQDKGEPMAELINFTIRCCGCNESIDKHQVLDLDAATDYLDSVQATFQRAAKRDYPLIHTKSKNLKKFRTTIADFIWRLTQNAHNAEILYDDTFCETFQTWLVAATSSRLRSFRHTTSVLALDFVSALCKVALEVDDELATASRQRDAELKKSNSDTSRLQLIQDNVANAHKQKQKVEEYLQDLFDGVFVHRYRDAEPAIRCECVKALGTWMQTYPDHYLDGDHLRYVGWNLTDVSKDTRLEAIKALDNLYAKPESFGAMQHFTERFKVRMIEMASAEPEMPIRSAAVSALRHINIHGLLETEQQAELSKLIFHLDIKVRKAVAPFCAALIQEAVDEQADDMSFLDEGHSDTHRKRLWFNIFAAQITELTKQLIETQDQDAADPFAAMFISSAGVTTESRLSLAIKSLWSEAKPLREWKILMDYLLLDSTVEGDISQEAQEQLKMQNESETLLVETLGVIIGQTYLEHKASDSDDQCNQLTRDLIPLLPRLLEKYQAEPDRLVAVLPIVPLLNIELYLDMRILSEYEALWSMVGKLFLNNVHFPVLQANMKAIRHLCQCTSLSQVNTTQRNQILQGSMIAIRDITEGKDVSFARFTPEELEVLTACVSRVYLLGSFLDISSTLEDNGGLKFTSIYTVLVTLLDRAMIGSKEEESLAVHAIHSLVCYFGWNLHILLQESPPSESRLEFCIEVRDSITQYLINLAFGTDSSATEKCRRTAFVNLARIYLLLSRVGSNPGALTDDPSEPLANLRVQCPDELQYQCAGFIEAEIQQHTQELGLSDGDMEARAVSVEDEEAEEVEHAVKDIHSSLSRQKEDPVQQLEHDTSFIQVVAAFVNLLNWNVIDLIHCSRLLPHFGRFGILFDECIKSLVEVVKDSGLFEGNVTVAVTILEDTFDEAINVLGAGQADDDYGKNLFKFLLPCIMLRTSGLAIQKQLPSGKIATFIQHLASSIISKIVSLGSGQTIQQRQRQTMSLFKYVEKLLPALSPSDALDVQKHIEQTMTDKRVGMSSTDKKWDMCRSLLKKLSAHIAKDPAIVRAAKRARKDNLVHSEDDSAGEGEPRNSNAKKDPRGQRISTRQQPLRRSATGKYREYSEDAIDSQQDDAIDSQQDDAQEVDEEAAAPRKRARTSSSAQGLATLSIAGPGTSDQLLSQHLANNDRHSDTEEEAGDPLNKLNGMHDNGRRSPPSPTQASQASLSAFRTKKRRR